MADVTVVNDVNSFIRGITQPQKTTRLITRNTLGEIPGVGPFENFIFDGLIEGVQLGALTDERRRGIHLLADIDPPTIDPPRIAGGAFISAYISKLRGNNDNTIVVLMIDRRRVVEMSFKKAKDIGLKTPNPFGVMFLKSSENIKTLAMGFPTPLFFRTKLQIYAKVVESNVTKIETTVVFGTDGGGAGEPLPPPGPISQFP